MEYDFCQTYHIENINYVIKLLDNWQAIAYLHLKLNAISVLAFFQSLLIAETQSGLLLYLLLAVNNVAINYFDSVDTDSVWRAWCCPGQSGPAGGGWKPGRRGWSCDPWDPPGTLSQSCYQSTTSTSNIVSAIVKVLTEITHQKKISWC